MATHNRRISKGRSRQRHISVRAIRREEPDLRKLSKALLQYALESAAAEAAAQADHRDEIGRTSDAETTDV